MAICFFVGLVVIARPAFCESGPADPWQLLREDCKQARQCAGADTDFDSDNDPWARLRAIYLPFTEAAEKAAKTDKAAGREVADRISTRLGRFEAFIQQAARRFHVPEAIIAAVIMVESGGNPGARAKTSTAAGLMQTIAGTFADARAALKSEGIDIKPSPLDPEASIMAGTWYLDRMYGMAQSDYPAAVTDRHQLRSWKYPLQYYYAGPANGARPEPVVIVYAGGRRIRVDKSAYSEKALRWANTLKARQ